MSQDPHIAAAVVFGRGRPQAGILVEPKSDYAFNPIGERELAEFRNKLWCVLELCSWAFLSK